MDYIKRKAGKQRSISNGRLFYLVLTVVLMMQFRPAFSESTPSSSTPQSIALKTAIVKPVTLSREFRLDGTVEAINKATVSAQTGGSVEEILVDVDDYVEKDSIIIRLKDVSQQAQLKKVLAGEKEAISHLSRAEDEYERVKDIYAKKVVSKAKMDEATHSLSAAKARLESARASLEEAREQLSYTRITAPYSGIVTERHIELGENVQPGAKLMTGVSLDKLRVNVDVPQSLIRKIRQYGKAYVYTQSVTGSEPVQVKVEKITVFPIADHASNTFKVRLDLPHGIDGLFPGMFVKASLVTGEKDVLMVPQSSVVHRSEVTAIYVIKEDGTINFRHIRTGNTNDDSLVVLSGLIAGEKVALDPIRAGIVAIEQKQQLQRQRSPAGHGDD
jgi:RND family efflux transporter MFP subunit